MVDKRGDDSSGVLSDPASQSSNHTQDPKTYVVWELYRVIIRYVGSANVKDSKMIRFLLAVNVLVLLAWLIFKWMRLKSYWKNRGVPHVPMYPLIGSLTFLMRHNPAIWMRHVYDSFDSPYVGMWLFFRPALVVNDLEIGRNILIRDSAVFRNRFLSSAPSDPIGHLNMFTANDPLWSWIRRHMTTVFTSAKMKGIFEIMRQKSKELLERIDRDMKKYDQVNLRMMFTDYTTDVIGAAAFGLRDDATLGQGGPLRVITSNIMKFSLHRGFSWLIIFFYPELVDVFRSCAFPRDVVDYFRKVFRACVQERGGYEVENVENRDLLDALIKLKQVSVKENVEISEDTLVAQAASFVQGAFDTTGSILSFCVYELAFNQDSQEKLHQELLALQEKIGHNDFDAKTLADAKYLDCVINETMRKYPPMGWLDRVASTRYQLDEHLAIEAGTPVYVNAVGMHYDAAFFPEPKSFIPERFEDQALKREFMPFGDGPRACIGKRFAMLNLRKALSSVFLHWQAFPAEKAPHPTLLEPDARNLFLAPGSPLLVRFIHRN